MACANCGLPEGTDSNKGRTIQLTQAPEYGSKRQRKAAAWVCSDECAYQALGLAKYGPSHKWPISLAKFRSATRLDQKPARG